MFRLHSFSVNIHMFDTVTWWRCF